MGRPRAGLRGGDVLGEAGAREQSLKVVASLTKCLLGPGALEFFRFRSAGCLGNRNIYPFAILLRELSMKQKGELQARASSLLAGTTGRASREDTLER